MKLLDLFRKTTPVTPTGNIKVAIVNFDASTNVTFSSMVTAAAAFTKVCRTAFALPPPAGYGISATVRAATPSDVKADEWVIGLFSHPDQPGALGYHDETPSGLPLAKVFPLLDAQDGVSWQSTASHELWEMLADPNLCKCAQDPATGNIWAYEVADACEAISQIVDGVEVSDFCTPAYFEPSHTVTVKFDWCGKVLRPYQILPGGYGQTFDPTKGWVSHNKSVARNVRRAIPGRGARRHAKWLNNQSK